MILADSPDGLPRARLTPDCGLVVGSVERLVVAHADRIPAGVTGEDKGARFFVPRDVGRLFYFIVSLQTSMSVFSNGWQFRPIS